MIGYPNGTNILNKKLEANVEKSNNLGIDLANLMIEDNAIKILDEAQKIAFKDGVAERL